MSNIVVSQFGISFSLKSLAEVRFNSPCISNIPEEVTLKFITGLITETYIKCGSSINDKDLEIVCSLFLTELKMFPYLTVKEIRKSFNSGYKEHYGKYYGLNIKTFVGWLDGYIKNDRNNDLNKLKPKKVPNQETITKEEAVALISSGMSKCFDYWDEHGQILDGYSNFLYDVLFDDGFLPKDKETKEKFMHDAKTLLQFEIANKKASTRKEHLEIKETLNSLSKSKSLIVINKAKELIVCKFMRDTWRNEESLSKLKKKYVNESK